MPSGTGELDLAVDLARRIRAARALSGKKIRELADELGWHDRKLYRLEGGTQEPSALELAAIAEATNQPLEFFFETTTSGAEERGTTFPDPLPAVKEDAA